MGYFQAYIPKHKYVLKTEINTGEKIKNKKKKTKAILSAEKLQLSKIVREREKKDAGGINV